MFGGGNEALWIAIGGGGIGGIWSIVSWKIRRRDQNDDSAEKKSKLSIDVRFNEVHKEISKTNDTVKEIEVEKLKTVDTRLTALEAIQIGYKEMKELLDSTLTTHLTPIIEAEKKNTEDVSDLKQKLFEMELENKLEAKYKNNQSG